MEVIHVNVSKTEKNTKKILTLQQDLHLQTASVDADRIYPGSHFLHPPSISYSAHIVIAT